MTTPISSLLALELSLAVSEIACSRQLSWAHNRQYHERPTHPLRSHLRACCHYAGCVDEALLGTAKPETCPRVIGPRLRKCEFRIQWRTDGASLLDTRSGSTAACRETEIVPTSRKCEKAAEVFCCGNFAVRVYHLRAGTE
jgi:hypothetical protein